jgi:hypothetical protein
MGAIGSDGRKKDDAVPSVVCQIARGMRGARVCQPCQPLSHEKKDSVVAALLPWQATGSAAPPDAKQGLASKHR